MTTKRTAEGCIVTSTFEVTESGSTIEHIVLECEQLKLELVQPIREKVWYTRGD